LHGRRDAVKKMAWSGVALVLTMLLLGTVTPSWAAQEPAEKYPTKPVKIINPFGAGGGNDRRFRILSSVIDQYLGQPLIVVDRPGGSGTIGTMEGAKAAPDGYTLIVYDSSPMVIVPLTLGAPYDPLKDFEYVLQTHAYQRAVAAAPTAPFRTWPEFVTYAKANPGKVKVGLGDGALGEAQLWIESILSALGIAVAYVPFDSAAEAAAAAAGGHVMVAVTTIPAADSLVREKKVVPLLNSFADKHFGFPGVHEYALDNFEYESLNGILAPKGTPPAIIAKLDATVREAMKNKLYLSLAEKTGELPVVRSGEELRRVTQKNIELMKSTVAKLKNK
jgi:tripartite-type tricarboxylate transporter receptor subunit TctC